VKITKQNKAVPVNNRIIMLGEYTNNNNITSPSYKNSSQCVKGDNLYIN
jgi:hypothetical protein